MRSGQRQRTLAESRRALDRGCVVWLSVDNDWGEVDCHAVLVYGQRRNAFDVYSPEISGSCLQQYRPRQLDSVWLRSEGMTAVWRDVDAATSSAGLEVVLVCTSIRGRDWRVDHGRSSSSFEGETTH